MSNSARVKPGEMLRDFTLTDLNGQPVSLRSFRGRSSVLLSFFRDASCPFCNLRLYELTRKQEDYRRQGMEIIAVFNSSPEVIQKYLGKRDRPFPLLADANKEIFKLYGVESSWGILMKGMFNFSRMFSAFSKGFMPAAGAFKRLNHLAKGLPPSRSTYSLISIIFPQGNTFVTKYQEIFRISFHILPTLASMRN